MSYQLITAHNAVCYTKGRGGNKIRYIVIHHWDDPAKHPQFNGVINWFKNPRSKVSAHYVVEAGRAARMVSESDTAWHAGNWAYNQQSIGIECNPRCSEEDKRTVAELVNDIRARYGNLPLLGHKDIVSTGCPGRYYHPNTTLAPYLGKSSGGGATPGKPSGSAPSTDVTALARAVINGDYGNGEERKRRLGARYNEVQAEVNRLLGISTTPNKPDLNALADAVIRGDYGNGEERKRRLGSLYREVQALVNKKLGY